MYNSDYSSSRPDTAATGISSLQNSSTDSFAYSVISSKFESTGEVILLPKVNARRSIKFKKDMTGPRIIAVRETAQWLISNNNRVSEDLTKEVQRLDDSYLKWYRKHFNDKRDVLDRVSNLLNSAKKEKNDRCISFSSYYKNLSTPNSRRSRMHSMQTSSPHKRTPCFTTELPEVEDVNIEEKVNQEEPELTTADVAQLNGTPNVTVSPQKKESPAKRQSPAVNGDNNEGSRLKKNGSNGDNNEGSRLKKNGSKSITKVRIVTPNEQQKKAS